VLKFKHCMQNARLNIILLPTVVHS
jgi:hypothetical protein